MEFKQVAGSRRSIRWFKTWKPVPEAKIQRILEAARLCTSPGNIQPWRAIVVNREELSDETRDELLAADHWQGAHVQAPVWIYWFGDVTAPTPAGFTANVIPLIQGGAAPRAFGFEEEAFKRAMDHGEALPEGAAGVHELVPNLTPELQAAVAMAETVGACAFAVLAAVDEGLGSCLHMAALPSKQARLREILKVPDHWIPVWVQLVGYPAEEPEAGGQRPRLPFEDLFFKGQYGTPFHRDEQVVAELEQEQLLQAPMPLPGRMEELRFLARMYGYPELA
jgi:nitroreductase